MRNAIFWPLVAQVLLVAIVTVRLYASRIGELKARRINPQSIATSQSATVLKDIAAADNFRNLFEAPVLFFAVCITLAVTDTVTQTQLVLAWIYVGLRAVHSFIHITYNRVMHRFAAFLASMACLFLMWGLFAWSLWKLG